MIFLNLLNRIFGPKKALSRQEIEDYKAGTGNTHDIESKAAGSDFNDQALEGWKSTSSSLTDGMVSLDKKMNQFVNTDNFGGSSTKGMALSFILFTLTMLALIIFTYQGNSVVEKSIQIVEEVKDESSRSEKIDFYTAISPEKQITSNELIKNQDIKSTESQLPKVAVNNKENSEIETQVTEVEKEEIQLPIQSSGKIPNSSKNSLIYKNAQEIYLSSLKNVDYRAYRNRPIKTPNFLAIGIPANQASKEDEQEFPSLQMTEITYIDYLTTSSAFFSNGKYKTALKYYLTILDDYPDDVNANFYGGLCYFNLGEFDQSTALLRKSYTLGYGNFREEARWFTAKALVEQNHIIKARYLLSDIVNEDGFYRKSADELLKKIMR